MLDTVCVNVKVKTMARPKDEDLGDDFSYILRMADTDMDGLKPLATALTSVKGVGARTAIQICKNTGFDPYNLAGFLTAEQQEELRLAIESYAENVPEWMLNRQRDLESGFDVHINVTASSASSEQFERLTSLRAGPFSSGMCKA